MSSDGGYLANGQVNQTNGYDVHHAIDQGPVPVHTYDPEAPPSEKRAATMGLAAKDLNIQQTPQRPTAQELPVEQPRGGPVPTITIDDIDKEKVKEAQETSSEPATEPASVVDGDKANGQSVPGELPEAPAPAIPDWYLVGWRQVSGADKPKPELDGEEKDKGVLDAFLAEQYYGDWYHNAGIIIFAVLASHFLTRFNLGWGWLFIVLAICSTYYTTSVARVRRRIHYDVQQELVKTRLASEHESAEWLNNFLDRFWLIYEPVLSASIVASVDSILNYSTPTFLDSMRLTTFTLGNRAPRIDKVRTFPKTDDDIVLMDWGISFTPNDMSDLTDKQKEQKINPKIVLSVRVGKGITAPLPILVEDITFSGLMRIRMKLVNNFPHVQLVDISFLEKPLIDFSLKPIGGDTFGFDIANVPGLAGFIQEMTHSTLGPMMYEPNVFTLNLEQMLSGKPLDAAIGVIQVTVHSARGIKGTKIGGGTPDPYVGLSLNNRPEVARTKYKKNTYNPTWMESKFLLVNNLHENLVLNLWDFNDVRKDSLLGSATFDLSKLLDDASQEGLSSAILRDGKERGEIRYDVTYYPVLEPDESKEAPVDSTVGIVRVTIHQAKELDSSKSGSSDLNPLAKLYIGDTKRPSHQTTCYKRTKNPFWESPYEFLCSDKDNVILTVRVIDDRDFLKDPVIGYMSIKLTDLMASMAEGQDWFPLSNCKSGKIRITANWKPLAVSGGLQGSDQYRPPIGVVRLLLDRAIDVKNVEATLGGKSDPYVRVQVNNVTKGRTEVVNNNLNPIWDQIIYVPVHSLKETLMLECMDYQHLTKDRPLGSVEILVSDLAHESNDTRYPYASNGVKQAEDPLRLEKGNVFKGRLCYTAQFIPALALNGVKFDGHSGVLGQSNNEHEDEDSGIADSASFSSSDEEHQATPPGVTIRYHKKHGRLVNASSSSDVNGDAGSNEDSNETDEVSTPTSSKSGTKPGQGGVDMSSDELLAQQSGVLVVNVVSGVLAKKGRIEVLMDDGYWPCFSTTKSRSTHAQWQYAGEGFVKEIDFGQVWLRLNEAPEGDKDDIVAQWKGDVKQFLRETMNEPRTYTLFDQDGGNRSTVTVESRYVPVPVQLEARETVNNQGVLRVDLLDGQEIRGVDRSGKSDPYAVFTLNGQKVFKSQTQKKTLTPEWNEDFTISVPSRVGSEFTVEVFDWNQFEQAKSLGTGVIDLTDLEPFQSSERSIPLSTSKHGEKGQIRIRLMFQPEIIAKTRKNTSTFTTAGRAMTQFGGLPVAAGKGVLGVFRSKTKDDVDGLPSVADVQASQSQPARPPDVFDAQSVKSGGAVALSVPENGHGPSNGPQEPGTLRVTMIDAKDLPPDNKPYAVIRLGDKEYKTKHPGKTTSPEWNESFLFHASARTPKLFIWVHDHKTLGRDKELGEAEVEIWRHIKSEGTSYADVRVQLKPGGIVNVRLEFDSSLHPSNSNGSIHSSERISRTISIPSPSRFSIGGRRRGGDSTDD